nr:DUF1289 domain-containing protein [uncultured Azospirillum sp.]
MDAAIPPAAIARRDTRRTLWSTEDDHATGPMSGKSVRDKSSGDRSSGHTRNPCIGLCRFGGNGACLGCHRTKAEVKGWKRLGGAAKAVINARIRQGTQDGPAGEKAPRKRLRKLDKKIGKLEAKLAALRVERERVAGPGGHPPESSR